MATESNTYSVGARVLLNDDSDPTGGTISEVYGFAWRDQQYLVAWDDETYSQEKGSDLKLEEA